MSLFLDRPTFEIKLMLLKPIAAVLTLVVSIVAQNLGSLQWKYLRGTTEFMIPTAATPVTLTTYASSNTPGQRATPMMSMNEASDTVYLFGGNWFNTYYSDLWSYDISRNQWAIHFRGNSTASNSEVPGGLTAGCSIYDKETSSVYILGGIGYVFGRTSAGLTNDVWRFRIGDRWRFVTGSRVLNSPGSWTISPPARS